ncbi:MAG: TolC family protein [Bacteroidales bacterium]|jgi:outer membrane protein TolC
MRRLFIFLAISLLPVGVKTQDLQLRDCIQAALMNNPLSGNKDLARQINESKKAIIRSAWLPVLDLNAQATWQSDVVTLNLDLPFPVDFPQIPRDQYKVTADFNQIIYDGGSIRNQQILEDISSQLSVQEVEIKELELKQTVEDLFFAIIVLKKRTELVELMSQSLRETLRQLSSGVKNGIISESEIPVVNSEQIKIDQQLISIQSLITRTINTLGILIGSPIDPATNFVVPENIAEPSDMSDRPEFQMFGLQLDLLDARKNLLSAQLRPKVIAFGQAGYGKPGLNFLGDQWEPYLLVGLKGTWNVWDWGRVRRQRDTYSLSQKVINNQVESFTRQITQAEQSQSSVISEIKALLLKDAELLQNREEVTRAYTSKLNNGMITASQFVTEWTHEQEARLSQEVRKIELLSAEYKLLSIKGKF